MTNVASRSSASSRATGQTLARAGIATLLALAAPAISFLPALTTDIHGSGANVTFPHGYPLMITVTIVATVIACVAGALLAGRSALLAIPLGLALWVVIGFAILIAGLMLSNHTHLAEWGIALIAAVVAGAATGMPVAAWRGARAA